MVRAMFPFLILSQHRYVSVLNEATRRRIAVYVVLFVWSYGKHWFTYPSASPRGRRNDRAQVNRNDWPSEHQGMEYDRSRTEALSLRPLNTRTTYCPCQLPTNSVHMVNYESNNALLPGLKNCSTMQASQIRICIYPVPLTRECQVATTRS